MSNVENKIPNSEMRAIENTLYLYVNALYISPTTNILYNIYIYICTFYLFRKEEGFDI